jgi:hypothetical protein
MRRSQAIQRLPVDSQLATLILYDGERSDVLVHIPPGETITALVSPGDPFVAMIHNARPCLVARDAIAALGTVNGPAPAATDEDALPVQRRRARVRLRSGTALEGELRWIADDEHKQVADHVNDAPTFLIVYATETRTTYYVVKSQVAMIEEL